MRELTFNKIILNFDLDFTIIDNSEGIINSFIYALKKHHLPLVDKKLIRERIGEPLKQMFKELVPTYPPEELITSFIKYSHNQGIYQVKLLPKVKSKIKKLYEKFLLGIITSKKEELAQKVVKHLNLSKYFQYILGEPKERRSKRDPKIKEFLKTRYPNHTYLVIDDHPNDKALAEMLNSPFIGVLTGNHTREELKRNIKIPYKILNSVNDINQDIIINLVIENRKTMRR